MTFASEVKKECTMLEVHKEHAKAELAALIRMNGTINIYNQQMILNVQSENAAIARRIYSLLKEHFNVEGELLVRRKMKLKKNNVYIVRVRQHVQPILESLGLLSETGISSDIPAEVLQSDEKKRSYLRGAFLASGSVNSPERANYHLEIYSNYEAQSIALCEMMNGFDLNAKTVTRRNGMITYLKEAEKIADFLILIGATNAVLKFEDVRIVRDMRNSVNRLVNMEQANINKTIDASQKQLDAIRIIDETIGIETLPEKLRIMAEFRLANPDMSLKELGEEIPGGPISKSGINHRLRKLTQMAEKLK